MVEERVLGDVGVACCFHKKCYQKILRQKSCTVNIKWHISVFSMRKRISCKNKQIACSSTYLPSIDSRGSHSMQFQGCRNQGGQGAIVPPTHTASLDTIFVQIYMDPPPGVPGVSKNQIFFFTNKTVEFLL